MFVVTSNKSTRLLFLIYIGRIRLEELTSHREDIRAVLAELSAGFRVLADFTHLDSMDPDCLPEIGRMMDLLGQTGTEMVVRVIPDPRKDPGMNILTAFHYSKNSRVLTSSSLMEAVNVLSL